MIPRLLRAAGALIALTALLALPARAQLGGAEPPKHVLVASAAPVTVAAGGAASAEVRLTIVEGWHVNANPASPDYMIPTEVSFAPANGMSSGAPSYPAAVPIKFGFEENPVSVFSGTVVVRVPIHAAATATSGALMLRGTVAYQACNDQLCMAPASVPFTLAVTVTGGAPAAAVGPPPDSANERPDTSIAASGHMTAPPPPVPAGESHRALADALARGGLWWFLALFLGGLALNLTPCVFPMLGVTVSVFGARKQEPPLKVLTHAVAYVLGICVTYSTLGVIAALTGGLFGAALQNPMVNVGLGVLFVALALSMFGLYEMQPPAWLLLRLGGTGAGSLAGIFASGLAVGVIAAPCVGPFVVAVLALIAQRGDALFGFQTMFTLSLGLGFPYLLLAVFSNLIQGLPRSGDWMEWVKRGFGVLLTGIGFFYVLNGVAPDLTPWVLPVALLLGGFYLGFIDAHGAKKRGFVMFKRALGVAAVVGAIALGVSLRAGGIRFQPYDESAMTTALAQGRPVILEFSAAWCLPCHEMDQTTFSDPRVIELSRRFAVFKVDLTRYDSSPSRALRTRYGVTGVPEVLFVAPDGRERRELRVIGIMPPAPFMERMHALLGS